MIRIRPVGREELDALFALDQVCFRPGIAYSKVELKYFLFRPGAISMIAEGEGGIAGFAIVAVRAERGARIGHIVTLDVDPARRRHGVGKLLMDALMERCREDGAAVMRLEVAVDNESAIRFYRRLGFEATGRIRGFYMGKLDALVMERGLAVAA